MQQICHCFIRSSLRLSRSVANHTQPELAPSAQVQLSTIKSWHSAVNQKSKMAFSIFCCSVPGYTNHLPGFSNMAHHPVEQPRGFIIRSQVNREKEPGPLLLDATCTDSQSYRRVVSVGPISSIIKGTLLRLYFVSCETTPFVAS